MIEPTDPHDIRPLTADETLVVSGGQAVNPLLMSLRAKLPWL
jgi:hypothetical protein